MKKALKWGIVVVCLAVALYCAKIYVGKIVREQMNSISTTCVGPIDPKEGSTPSPSETEVPDISDEE